MSALKEELCLLRGTPGRGRKRGRMPENGVFPALFARFIHWPRAWLRGNRSTPGGLRQRHLLCSKPLTSTLKAFTSFQGELSTHSEPKTTAILLETEQNPTGSWLWLYIALPGGSADHSPFSFEHSQNGDHPSLRVINSEPERQQVFKILPSPKREQTFAELIYKTEICNS